MVTVPRGVMPPIPTLLADDGSVDAARMAMLVAGLSSAGVDGVVVLGTSGEGMVLPDARREAALSAVADQPLTRIVGCHGQSPAEVLARLETAASKGATFGLVPPPFYYVLRQPELVDFFTAIADASPLPIVLYHIPQLTRNAMTPATVRTLAGHHRIVGVKDSHGQAVEQAELLACQTQSFAVLQGLAPLLLNSYALGAAGSITPVGALFPQLELGLRQALRQGEVAAAADLQRRISTVASLFRGGGHPLVANLKGVAHLLGHGGLGVCPPGRSVPDEQLARLEEGLAAAGLLTDR